MQPRRLAPALALAAALTPLAAHASAPAGVWSLVDKVTLAPDMQKPTQIRVDGLFLVANELPDFPAYPGYSEPQSGYMYYTCPEGQQATCVMEWLELAAVAGTEDNCRGWGLNTNPTNGTVRPAGDPEANPDHWPMGMGIVQGFSPCDALRGWMGGETTGGETGDPGTGGESSSDTKTTGDPSGDPSGTGGDPTGDPSGTGGDPTGDPSGTGGDPSGDPGEGTAGETGIGGTGGDDPTTGAGETGGPAGETGGSAGEGASETGGGETQNPPADDDKGGCSCTATPSAPPAALALLTLLGLVRRRRA